MSVVCVLCLLLVTMCVFPCNVKWWRWTVRNSDETWPPLSWSSLKKERDGHLSSLQEMSCPDGSQFLKTWNDDVMERLNVHFLEQRLHDSLKTKRLIIMTCKRLHMARFRGRDITSFRPADVHLGAYKCTPYGVLSTYHYGSSLPFSTKNIQFVLRFSQVGYYSIMCVLLIAGLLQG